MIFSWINFNMLTMRPKAWRTCVCAHAGVMLDARHITEKKPGEFDTQKCHTIVHLHMLATHRNLCNSNLLLISPTQSLHSTNWIGAKRKNPANSVRLFSFTSQWRQHWMSVYYTNDCINVINSRVFFVIIRQKTDFVYRFSCEMKCSMKNANNLKPS